MREFSLLVLMLTAVFYLPEVSLEPQAQAASAATEPAIDSDAILQPAAETMAIAGTDEIDPTPDYEAALLPVDLEKSVAAMLAVNEPIAANANADEAIAIAVPTFTRPDWKAPSMLVLANLIQDRFERPAAPETDAVQLQATAEIPDSDAGTPDSAVQDNASGPLLTVTASSLNMRAGPATRFGVVAVLEKGAAAEATGERKRNWVEVRLADDGRRGWVFARYLRPMADG